ncbi:btb poz-like protein [Neofusicoccum parvum]|uniref:Btb poz-like protein n=1 Tax=Neofusicoccum parvum TaxID=310453 RepID=A0ACB5SCM1_9PEZI|nr:btb poz-like protein [Neofusicoccum parvum]
MDAPSTELLTAFASLLSSGKYSDLTVQSGEKSWAVHKAVICSRSGFFDGACSHPFKESASGIIDLSEDDPEAVEHMIHYFYHLDYLSKAPKSRRTTQPSSPTGAPVPRGHCSTQAGARRPGKLDLALVEDPLLAQAHAQSSDGAISATEIPSNAPASPLTPPHSNERIDYFSSIDAKLPLSPTADAQHADDDRLDCSYESESEDESSSDQAPSHLVVHAKVYAIAEKYGITGLKSLARRKYASQLFEDSHWSTRTAEFAESIMEVYESTVDTDRGLRDLVIQAFREHPELARSRDIELVIRDTPGAAWELFRLGWGLPVC